MNKYEMLFFSLFISITSLYSYTVMNCDFVLLYISTMLYIIYGLWFCNFLVYMTSKSYKKKREKYMNKKG